MIRAANQLARMSTCRVCRWVSVSLAVGLAFAPLAAASPQDPGTGDWVEVQKITAPDAAPEDYFGLAVAIDGDTLVIGSSLDDDAGSASGSVYVYERRAGSLAGWTFVQKLVAADSEPAGDRFGYSVSLDGDTLCGRGAE